MRDYNKFRSFILGRVNRSWQLERKLIRCLDYIDSAIGFDYFIRLHDLGFENFYSRMWVLCFDVNFKVLLRDYGTSDTSSYSSYGVTESERFRNVLKNFYYVLKNRYCEFLSY